MQIEHKDNQWLITPESQQEDDVLHLVLPLIQKFCTDFIIWLNNVVLSAL